MKNDSKKLISTWLIFIACSAVMSAMAAFNQWTYDVYIIIWCAAALITFFTFSPKISVDVQATGIMLLAMGDIFMCSILERNVYPSIIVMCGCSILVAVYKKIDLMISQMILSAIIIATHIFIFNTVNFDNISDIIGFAVRVLVLLASEAFLIHIIAVLKKTENNLNNSLVEAKAAEISKSDFLSNMSHELRTPMNAIIGMCELMMRETEVNDDAKEYCYNIQSSSKNLLQTISDILDFSKIESGEMILSEEEFDIVSIINDVADTALNRIGEKKIEFIVHVTPDFPKGIIGDEFRIRQIILNLVSNAIKYTRSGAIILDISHTMQKYGINLNVSVTDTGIGIAEENYDKLFMRFHQIDSGKKKASEGIGLGLAISKQLVTIMGGFIDVESVYGVGSEFRFSVPLGISNDAPLVTIKNPEKINVAAYFNSTKFLHKQVPREYKKLAGRINQGLKTHYTFNGTFENLRKSVESENLTHIFTGKEEYVKYSEYFDKLSEKITVYVIQNRTDAIKPNANVKTILKPFYIVNCATALNTSSDILEMSEPRSLIKFSAPMAKVLVVDDNLINLKVASGLMRPYGVQIFTAQSGESAISLLRSKDINLVFMDNMMPNMDGTETMHKIRSMNDEYYKNLPIVVLTANAVNGTREALINEGFDDFMTKPIELSALNRVLSTYIPEEYMEAPVKKAAAQPSKAVPMVTPSESAILDTAEGLLYTGDDSETYNDILSLFVKESEEKINHISRLCELNDWKKYIIEVHALKSAAKNIGADSLSELSKELEFAGKSNNFAFIKEKNAALTELFRAVSLEAEKYLALNADKNAASDANEPLLPEIDKDKLARHAASIIRACSNFDGDEIEKNLNVLFRHSYNSINLKNELSNAATYAEEFEYEAASDEIKEFLRRIGDNE